MSLTITETTTDRDKGSAMRQLLIVSQNQGQRHTIAITVSTAENCADRYSVMSPDYMALAGDGIRNSELALILTALNVQLLHVPSLSHIGGITHA